MEFTEIINIAVVLLSGVGGYVVYIMKTKAAHLEMCSQRLYALEKKNAVMDNEIENINKRRL